MFKGNAKFCTRGTRITAFRICSTRYTSLNKVGIDKFSRSLRRPSLVRNRDRYVLCTNPLRLQHFPSITC